MEMIGKCCDFWSIYGILRVYLKIKCHYLIGVWGILNVSCCYAFFIIVCDVFLGRSVQMSEHLHLQFSKFGAR